MMTSCQSTAACACFRFRLCYQPHCSLCHHQNYSWLNLFIWIVTIWTYILLKSTIVQFHQISMHWWRFGGIKFIGAESQKWSRITTICQSNLIPSLIRISLFNQTKWRNDTPYNATLSTSINYHWIKFQFSNFFAYFLGQNSLSHLWVTKWLVRRTYRV